MNIFGEIIRDRQRPKQMTHGDALFLAVVFACVVMLGIRSLSSSYTLDIVVLTPAESSVGTDRGVLFNIDYSLDFKANAKALAKKLTPGKKYRCKVKGAVFQNILDCHLLK